MDRDSRSDDSMYQLLLLPTPLSDVSDVSLSAAYGPALQSVLNNARGSGGKPPAKLDIAIQCPLEPTLEEGSRSFGYFERIIARLISLVVYISSESGNSLDTGEVPDVAAFFINGRSNDGKQLNVDDLRKQRGPVIPCETLAFCQRPWSTVYFLDGEGGEGLLRDFTQQRQSLSSADQCPTFETHRVPGGTSTHTISQGTHPTHSDESKRHESVAVGGTFDHIHAGHKLLLTATALALDRRTTSSASKRMLTIGITGDELLKNKKYAEYLESWEHRQQSVYAFLSRIINFSNSRPEEQRFNEPGPNGKGIRYSFHDGLVINCVELSDPFGPTITDEAISALVVSAETRSGGQAVNDKRKEKGWEVLEVFEVDVLDVKPASIEVTADKTDFQSKISSTEIRRQLHDRHK